VLRVKLAAGLNEENLAMTYYVTPFERTIRRRWVRPGRGEATTDESYDVLVPVNVRGEEDAYVITALVPGAKVEDLSIQVLNETVTLQGEIKGPKDEEEYLVRECPTGRFYRTIRLPVPLDSGKAQADLSDGVLTLRVPKAEAARPRTIKVQAN
jgi:HSP20 family protein